jgi:putative hemolysin
MPQTLDIEKHPVFIKPVFSLNELLARPYKFLIMNFKQKVKIFIDRGSYTVKTIDNSTELEEALQLRHDVFYKELLRRNNFIPVDMDKYDMLCDHLIITEKTTGSIIGTYRLNSSVFSKLYYSENEFDITSVKNLDGNKLELGRACVHKDYRNGLTIALLWKGLMAYAKATDTRYLFGCSSIKTMDHNELKIIFGYLKKHFCSDETLRVYPKGKFRSKSSFTVKEHLDLDSAFSFYNCGRMLPSLLTSYLKAGARICGEPAIDRQFKCSDFFTLLDLESVNKPHENKFM